MVYHPNIDLEGNVCLNILRWERSRRGGMGGEGEGLSNVDYIYSILQAHYPNSLQHMVTSKEWWCPPIRRRYTQKLHIKLVLLLPSFSVTNYRNRLGLRRSTVIPYTDTRRQRACHIQQFPCCSPPLLVQPIWCHGVKAWPVDLGSCPGQFKFCNCHNWTTSSTHKAVSSLRDELGSNARHLISWPNYLVPGHWAVP